MAVVGRYEIIQKLGEGGMGIVFLAKDPLLGRLVAIKLISNRGMAPGQQSDGLRTRFLQEAKVVALLNHHAIVSIFDLGEHNGLPYIVMEYVRGQSLYGLLQKRPLRLSEAVQCVKTVASALDYAHSQHVIHRDIKPANLLVSETGVLKVTDFGVAKLLTTPENTNSGVVGTLAYMAPEQFHRSVEPQSDQYALASLAYELIVGQAVFQAESVAALVYKICNETPKPPNLIRPEIRFETARVLEKGLAKTPAERFPTCLAFALALEMSVEGAEPRAPSLKVEIPANVVADIVISPPSFAVESPNGPGKVLLIGALALVVACGVAGLKVLDRPSADHSADSATPPSITRQPQYRSAGSLAGVPPPGINHLDAPNKLTNLPNGRSTVTMVSARAKSAGSKMSSLPKQQAAIAKSLPVTINGKDGTNATPATGVKSENQGAYAPADGRLVWTGILEAGQQIDLSQPSNQGSPSGALPGVPVKIEVHPSGVRVITPPGPENGWRQIVVQNDNTKRSLVLVRWSAIGR